MSFNDKWICSNCIGDSIVIKKINSEGSVKNCSYCDQSKKSILFTCLSELVDKTYRKYYIYEHPEKYYAEGGTGYKYRFIGDYPEEIIRRMLMLSDSGITRDLISHLSEIEEVDLNKSSGEKMYDSSSKYIEKSLHTSYYSKIWDTFCDQVKHHSRFFSTKSLKIIDELFRVVNSFPSGTNALRMYGGIEEEKYFYRARRGADSKINKDLLLNPIHNFRPPPSSSTKFGRMNSIGISVLYGGLSRQTCIDELRLSTGDTAFTIKFEILISFRVLDLTVFNHLYDYLSMFDDKYESKLNHINFLRKFGDEISKPITSKDEELDYIPTQAFAEYLADYFSPRIDAVLYNSAQNPKNKNIVFLKNYPGIKELMDLKETKKNPDKYDQISPSKHYILKKIDSRKSDGKQKIEIESEKEDGTSQNLKIVTNSNQFHRINWVKTNYTSGQTDIYE